MKTYKQDHALMDLLKLNEINRIICDTNMGTLKLRIRKGEKEYRFVLDSVELDKTTNKELFELIYPPITKDVRDTPIIWNGNVVSPNSKEANIIKSLNPNKTLDARTLENMDITKPKGRTKGKNTKKHV